MVRKSKWLVALSITVLAFGLLFGSAMAHPGDSPDDGDSGWDMHGQMDPEMYGQMIQRMTEIHGAEFTAEMLQHMNEEGGCHGDGEGMMGGDFMHGGGMHGGMMEQDFSGAMNGVMRGVQGMMNGAAGMMSGNMMSGGGMMGH